MGGCNQVGDKIQNTFMKVLSSCLEGCFRFFPFFGEWIDCQQARTEAGRQVRRLLQPFQRETGGSDHGGARTMGREREYSWRSDNSYPLELLNIPRTLNLTERHQVLLVRR